MWLSLYNDIIMPCKCTAIYLTIPVAHGLTSLFRSQVWVVLSTLVEPVVHVGIAEFISTYLGKLKFRIGVPRDLFQTNKIIFPLRHKNLFRCFLTMGTPCSSWTVVAT